MRIISAAVAVALLISACASKVQAAVMTGNFGPETLTLINSYRVSRGLSPLVSSDTLQALARQHSQFQATRRHPHPRGLPSEIGSSKGCRAECRMCRERWLQLSKCTAALFRMEELRTPSNEFASTQPALRWSFRSWSLRHVLCLPIAVATVAAGPPELFGQP